MIENCFVLRQDKDPAAVAALRAYAEATDNDTLSADIINWVGEDRNEPLTLDELRQMDGEPVWVVVSGHTFGWCLVSADCEAVFKQNAGCTFSEIINHGFAYRSKPKEV